MPLSGACGPRIELPQAAVAMVSRKARIERRRSFMVCTSYWVPAWGRASRWMILLTTNLPIWVRGRSITFIPRYIFFEDHAPHHGSDP